MAHFPLAIKRVLIMLTFRKHYRWYRKLLNIPGIWNVPDLKEFLSVMQMKNTAREKHFRYPHCLFDLKHRLPWWLSCKESACQRRRHLIQEDTLEKEMASHSSILAWRIPGMEEPGGLPSMGLHRVRHDWSDLAAAAAAATWAKCFQT